MTKGELISAAKWMATVFIVVAIAVFAFTITVPFATNETIQKRGEARLSVFRECMQLAAALPRQADDDVSDVVDSCSSQAAYMTRFIK
jgi:hypothetical protein